MDSPALQVNAHAPVAGNTIIFMVDLFDLPQHRLFLGIIFRLPVFPVVIISIRADPLPLQQPADSEFLLVLVKESISL
jgi:hypothetical protein